MNPMRVVAIKAIPDTPASILDYLVQRTCDTIGKRVERAEAVVVGEVEATGGDSVRVQDQHASTLSPWFSGEAGPAPSIMIYRTGVRVTEWLKASEGAEAIEIAYVPRWTPSGSEHLPLFEVHDRGLMYLRRVSAAAPYAAYIPPEAYQLIPGEIGMRKLPANRQSHDEAADANDEIDAVRWYVALPKVGAAARRDALLDALSAASTLIAHHSARELAESRASGAPERFTSLLKLASGHRRTELMLALWLVGERDTARQLLERILEHEREAFLADWGLRVSSRSRDETTGVLFGPAPSVMKNGDDANEGPAS